MRQQQLAELFVEIVLEAVDVAPCRSRPGGADPVLIGERGPEAGGHEGCGRREADCAQALDGIGPEIRYAPVLEPAREPVPGDVSRWVGRHQGGMGRIDDMGLAGHGLAVMVPGELGDLVVAAHEGEPRELGRSTVHLLAPILALPVVSVSSFYSTGAPCVRYRPKAIPTPSGRPRRRPSACRSPAARNAPGPRWWCRRHRAGNHPCHH